MNYVYIVISNFFSKIFSQIFPDFPDFGSIVGELIGNQINECLSRFNRGDFTALWWLDDIVNHFRGESRN